MRVDLPTSSRTAPRPRSQSGALASMLSRLAVILASLSATGCSDDGGPLPPKPITVVNAFPAYGDPMWTPDGLALLFNHVPLKRIYESQPGVFYYEFIDSLAGIYTVAVSGQGQRRILSKALETPDLSHDGASLFYASQGQIWRLSVQGDSIDASSELQVTSSLDGASGPSISYSGTRLLYWVGSGPNAGVHITGSTGGLDRNVGAYGWRGPDWQPNDSSFAFFNPGGPFTGVGIVDTFGVNAMQVHSEGDWPRWAPDGTRIAFLAKGGGAPERNNLWVMNRDGSGVRQLTTEGVLPQFNWSPDGSRIAYVRFFGPDTSYVNGTIWTINTSTLDKQQITFNSRP